MDPPIKAVEALHSQLFKPVNTSVDITYTRSALIGLTRLSEWCWKFYKSWPMVFSDIVRSIVLSHANEWSSPKRWNSCTNRSTINLSLWQYSLIPLLFQKFMPPLYFSFCWHLLLFFTCKLLRFINQVIYSF